MKTLTLFAIACAAQAQMLDLKSLDKLAEKASESANVTLDGDKLGFVSGFLSSGDPGQQKVKGLIAGLKGVHVRTFEFAGKGMFSQADLKPILAQLSEPGWTSIVSSKSGEDRADVYLFTKGKEVLGLAVIAIEPTEVAVVNIVGPIDLAGLTNLGGSFGIPKLDAEMLVPKPKAPPATPKREHGDDEF